MLNKVIFFMYDVTDISLVFGGRISIKSELP